MSYKIVIHPDFIELKHFGYIDFPEVERARKEVSDRLITHKLNSLLVDATEMGKRLSSEEEYRLFTTHSQVLPFGTKIAIIIQESTISLEDARYYSTISDIYATKLKFFSNRESAIEWFRATK